MASRDTEKEAIELKAKIEKDFPDLNITLDHSEGESAVFPGAVKVQKLTVSRWDKETPYAKWEKWFVRELVICRCGKEWKTDAIGENNSTCSECAEALRTARDPRTDAQVRADTHAELARDLHLEWWCQ